MFTAEQLWQVAAGLERCAIGYAQDATLYRGRRQEWRLSAARSFASLASLKMVEAVEAEGEVIA
jgi:hypothetical protein